MYFWGLGLNTECGGVTSPHKNLVKTSKLGNHISLEAIEEPILLWLMYIAKAVAANIAAINFFGEISKPNPAIERDAHPTSRFGAIFFLLCSPLW